MAKKKDSSQVKLKPTLSDEARENRLISMAMDRAEEKLQDGTASSQLIIEVIKWGSSKTKLANEKLQEENKLSRARTEAIQSGKEIEKLYSDAIEAMRKYGGHGDDNEY